ncbi:MAG: acyltransferase family protein [Prevotella sp.]
MDNSVTHGGRRIDGIDFVKCVCIILMVAFHIVAFGDSYPYAKRIVYTFHMPVFLIVSGFLMGFDKPARGFAASMVRIALPYAVMEILYVAMAAVLPIREHIDVLTPAVMLDALLLHPIGPYWYLHTMLICGIVMYLAGRLPRIGTLEVVIISALALYGLSLCLDNNGLFVNALYFFAGAALRRSGKAFESFFRPAALAAVPFAILACHPECADKAAAGGVMMVYLAMSLMLYINKVWEKRTSGIRNIFLFIGRNTLVILLFSPVFTAAARLYQPLLVGIDASGMLFMTVTVLLALAGSVALGMLSDRLGISPCIFRRRKIIG